MVGGRGGVGLEEMSEYRCRCMCRGGREGGGWLLF